MALIKRQSRSMTQWCANRKFSYARSGQSGPD